MKLRAFITHKAAESYSDCADYFNICIPSKRVAVSDGVSQSIMPAEWAKILVDSFVNEKWVPGQPTDSLKEEWLAEAKKFTDTQRSEGKNPWMLENCIANKDGAAATFCGVVFSDECKWKASILGDSSLVEINKDNRILRICSSREGTFDNYPDFFDSFKEDNGEIREFDGILKEGLKILLVSDPFSELFQKVRGTSDEVDIIKDLLNITDNEAFCDSVDKLRNERQMHNDDSTLVIIEPDDSDSMTIRYAKTLKSLIDDEVKQLEEEIEQDVNLRKKVVKEGTEVAYKKAAGNTFKEDCILNRTDGYQKSMHQSPSGHSVAEKEGKNKLSKPSEHGKTENKDESSESQSSEDPFCNGRDNVENNQSLQESTIMCSESAESSEETQKVPVSQQFEIKPYNNKKIEKSGSSASTKERDEPATEEVKGNSAEAANTALNGFGVNTEEVEVKSADEVVDIPKSVDPSDGIDKVEFQKFHDTAMSLFCNYHERFDAVFRRQKWNSDRPTGINKCFSEYLCELGRIIFQNKNNG